MSRFRPRIRFIGMTTTCHRVALLLALALGGVSVLIALQNGGTPPTKDIQFPLDDDGDEKALGNSAVAGNYNVYNAGPDTLIFAYVVDENGEIIAGPIEVPDKTTKGIGVPVGGTLRVRDAKSAQEFDEPDDDEDGAYVMIARQ